MRAADLRWAARRPRGPGAPRPAVAGAARGQRPGRLDQRGRPGLSVPPADGAAGGGVRGGDLLRDVLRAAPPRDGAPRVHGPGVRGGRGADRAVRRDRSGGPAAVSRRAQPLPGPVRTGSGGAGGQRAGESPVRTAVVGAGDRRGPSWAARAPRRGARGAGCRGWRCPQAGQDGLVLLRRVGVVDPAYAWTTTGPRRLHRAAPGVRARARPAVIREVTDSGLVGRGGAAFPTGRKWQATASQPDHPHYLVCNADESEPGTFKDRVVMEGDPYAAGRGDDRSPAYATGAHQGYLYLRGEYPRALGRLEHALDPGSRARPARRRRPRPGLRLRHRDPARRGRVHLR